MRCASGDSCLHVEAVVQPGMEEQYYRYNIYAGQWHEECWEKFGYKDFEFDASYAGESLEEDY